MSRPTAPSRSEPRRSEAGVAVLIVTHDDAADLRPCLEALAGSTRRPLRVIVVDCASSDDSVDVARRAATEVDLPIDVVPLGENRGFAGGMNEALARLGQAENSGEISHVLSLNADARVSAGYLGALAAALDARPRAGAATGRLVRFAEAGEERRLDACGMRLVPAWRHLDRASGEIDRGQLETPERVFGATGAASLFRRSALADVAVAGEVFDSRFHSFREDAELCFRLQERRWEVLYVPAARAEHRRCNLPERRSDMPAFVNYHSLKNRYLLRAYHQTPGNLLRTLPATLLRDVLAFGYVLLRERASLGAYRWLWSQRSDILRRRRLIQARRLAAPGEMERWFRQEAEPLDSRSADDAGGPVG